MKNKQQHIVSERFQKQTGKSWKHVKSITKHKYNEDKFEDTKGVIRICKWKKDRQIILHNPTECFIRIFIDCLISKGE